MQKAFDDALAIEEIECGRCVVPSRIAHRARQHCCNAFFLLWLLLALCREEHTSCFIELNVFHAVILVVRKRMQQPWNNGLTHDGLLSIERIE